MFEAVSLQSAAHPVLRTSLSVSSGRVRGVCGGGGSYSLQVDGTVDRMIGLSRDSSSRKANYMIVM